MLATVVDATRTKAAGVHGLLVSVARTDTATGTAGIQVGVEVSSLDASYGADAAARSRLVELPACSLTTPQAKGCLTPNPIASHYDPATKRLIADVTLAAATAPAQTRSAMVAGTASAQPLAAPMVLAAQPSAAGGGGSYAATSLSPSAAWTSGTAGGGFQYSYPIVIPPSVGGAAPGVSLSYDSSSVDGKTSSTNAQASIVGDGWDVSAGGYLERSYKPCNKDGITGSNDQCWGGFNATLSLAGHSGQLVHDDTTGEWHLQGDDGTKVEFITSGLAGGNGGTYGQYAKVSDSSGAVYYFGLNHLPGGDGTDPATNSQWSVPVYSPKSGDPCYNTTNTTASWCQMGWRFNLAYAVDVHGNLTTYSYTPDATNYYSRGAGQNQGTGTLTGYTPGGSLTRIDYGQSLAGQIAAKGTAVPAATVKLNLAPEGRCDTTGGFTCTGATISTANATHWPDVPYDQHCASTGTCNNWGPSFWTNQRLATITTQVQSAGVAKQVDSYALIQSYPSPGDGSTPAMWLASVQRTGLDGPALPPLPAVTFTPVMLPNRVDGTSLVPAPTSFNRPRIQQIATETGERINVDFNLPACSRLNHVMPASPDSDTMSCFSVLWYPPGSLTGAPPANDWFNRYTVKDITANDQVGGAPQRVTNYTYGKAAWHRDDSELTDTAVRTWGQFRGFDTVTVTTGSGSDGPASKSVAYYAQGMDGDYKANGTTKSVNVGTGTLAGAVTDSDWLSGHVLETDTYNHADATGNPGTVVAYTYTRTTGPATTATHVRGNGLPDLIARYDATNSITVTKALKADGTWRTSTTTTTTDATNSNRPTSSDTVSDGLPESCTTISYATGSNTQMTGLADEQRTLSGSGACTATATSGNTVSDTRVLYDRLPFGQAGATGDPTSNQTLDSYGTGGSPNYVTTTNVAYDSYGRPVSSTDPNATDSANPSGATTTTVYTPAVAGELPATLTVTSAAPGKPAGWVSTQKLDVARSLPLVATDANKKVTTATYDALGRITAVWNPGNATTLAADVLYTYAVNGSSGPSSTTTATFGPLGSKRLYSIQIFNGFGQVTQAQATPAISAYTGRMIADTYYDSQGRTVKAHGAWYNSDSVPSSTLFATSDTSVPTQTTTTYDGLGRALTSTFSSLGQYQSSSTTSYPGVDETDATPPAGATPTTTITDAAGRTSQLWNYHTATATGHATDADVTNYTYNAAGKAATRTDSTGKNTWSYTYDQRGRLLSASDPDTGTSSSTFTTDGQTATTTDARGQTLAYSYDLLGRKTGLYSGTMTPANQLAAWTYDTVTSGLGKAATATRYTGGANGTAYTQSTVGYDNAYHSTGTTTTMPGSLIGQTGTLSYTARAAYDPFSGVMTASQDGAAAGQAAETLNYSYDVNGPMIGYGSANTSYDVSSDYDPWGRPTRTTLNPWGTQVVATDNYDAGSGRILSAFIDKQTARTGSVDQYNYTYNQAGQNTSTQDIPDNTPASTDLQCYGYDYLGRLTTAWSDTGTTTTAPSPSIGGIGGCNDSTPTSGAAPGKTTVGGPAAYWTSYGYDLNGNPYGTTGNRTSQVQHDITGNTANDITTTQTFSPAGQNNTPTSAPNTGGGTGGPHALQSTTSTGPNNPGSSSYQYDAAGNTTAITTTPGTTSLAWNAEGRLATENATGTAGTTTYLYDADGNLLVKSNPKLTTVYLGNDQITFDPTSGSPAQDTRYYPTPNGLTVIRMGVIENFQTSDPHGTASLNINATTLAETRRYLDPFGNPRGTTPAAWTTANGFGDHGFVGGTQDPTTGLTNLGAREYQPSTGRFLNVDPLFNEGDPQSWNGYAYADNRPTNASDPSGLCISVDAGTCIGGQTGIATGGNVGVTKLDHAPGAAPTPTEDTCSPNVKGCPGYKVGPIRLPGGYPQAAQILKRYNEYINRRGWRGDNTIEAQMIILEAMCTQAGSDDAVETCGSLLSGLMEDYANKRNILLMATQIGHDPQFEHAMALGGLSATKNAGKDADALSGLYVDAIQTRLCQGNSFPAGTAVLQGDGSSKAIRDIRPGDTVVATSPIDGITKPEHVIAVIKTLTDTDFTDLLINTPTGTKTITSTQHHPYWNSTTQRWVNAAELHSGDQLREPTGLTATVAHVHNYTGHIVTYNLTVDDLHTYYVLAGTTPILVHNDGGTAYDSEGYSNYVLVDKNGTAYYSGMFGPNESRTSVMGRHSDNMNRFDEGSGDRIEVYPGTRTYGQARLLEQRMSVFFDTVIGKDGDNYRGNRQNPLAESNKDGYLQYEKSVFGGCS